MSPAPEDFAGRRAATARRARAWPSALPFIALLLVLVACVLALPVRAQQQQPPADADVDPPGRVARLNLADGPLSFAAAGSEQWTAAPYNRPLTDGDRLWTAQGSRAEIDTGGGLLWLDGATSLTFSAVDDERVQLQLTQGALALRLADLQQGDRFEIDTPNLAFVAEHGGDYRIDVDAARGLTQVTVLAGSALVYGERGDSAELRAGQRLAFSGRQLTPAAATAAGGSDPFDQWVAARDRALEQSTSARYVSPGTVGYQQLDQYGSWQTSSDYGSVWYPTSVPTNWAPYRYGQWSYIAPWGWTWVDDAPWGFAPFHYGRWVQSGSRWGWAPGRSGRRATYAPALVAFGGVGGGDVHWRPGRSSSWFPLAPGEAWRPGYRASDRYIDRVNHGILDHGGRGVAPDRFIYAGRPGAITSIDRTDWQQRRPVRGVPLGTGFDAPARAPFAQPAVPLPKPWAVTEQRPQPTRDPLRVQEAVAPPDWGSRRGRGDVFVPPPAAVAPIRNAQPMPKPYAVEVERRPLDGERLIHQQRQQQQTAQSPMRQQPQPFEQQQRMQQQQQQLQQQQQQQQQQLQQQRYQFEQQQRVQADQQRRAQADQWQQRQQQMQQQLQQQLQQQQFQQQQNQQLQQQQNSMREQQRQQQDQGIRIQQHRGPHP